MVKDLPVGHPDFGRLIPCRCREEEIQQRRIQRLRNLAHMQAFAEMRFDTFIPDGIGLPPEKQRNLRAAYEAAKAFAQDPRGWLLLKGGYGCGKTHLAAAIANTRLAMGEPVLFVVVPDLLDYLRAAYAPNSPTTYDERFEEVRTVPLLILDDLGTQNTTPWAQEKLFQLINYRYTAHLPTVITTNCELEDLDIRVRSRLADSTLVQIVPILAPDFRSGGVKTTQSELSTLSLHSAQTFETFDLRKGEIDRQHYENLKRALALAQDFAKDPRDWLVFMGPYGCGKTHLAAAIANARQGLGEPVLFVVVPDLLDHLRATFNPTSPVSYDQRFEEVRTAPLLVLDDLGTESATPWAREKLYQLFNYRYNARLPTVITTALELEQIDPRIRTRLLDMSRCTIFAITAPAYRGGGRGK